MRTFRHSRRGRLVLAVALTAFALSAAACAKSSSQAAGQSMASTQVKLALVPGGPHPYFQVWKGAGQQAKTDFKLGGVTFNETSGWNQTTQNSLLKSLEAQGYNAFGVFGVHRTTSTPRSAISNASGFRPPRSPRARPAVRTTPSSACRPRCSRPLTRPRSRPSRRWAAPAISCT